MLLMVVQSRGAKPPEVAQVNLEGMLARLAPAKVEVDAREAEARDGGLHCAIGGRHSIIVTWLYSQLQRPTQWMLEKPLRMPGGPRC
jgi:hypothetical protein